jgi:hypothetical protein
VSPYLYFFSFSFFLMVIGWPINFLLFRCEDARRRMLHERDRAASVLVEELKILGPQWHTLRNQQPSRSNASTIVSLHECSRPTIPWMRPPDISQQYISVVVSVVCSDVSEFCLALFETDVLRVPTRYNRDFALFSMSSSKNYSSPNVYRDVDTYSERKLAFFIILYSGSFFIPKH